MAAKKLFSIPLAILVLLPFCHAQRARRRAAGEAPPGTFKLLSIKVSGTKHYAPSDVAAATGLQIGQTVSEEDFQKASRHLGETGAFQDVAYTYQYSGEGAKLEFQVSENSQLVPVRFENLVWFSDQDLMARLHQEVPMFTGELPVSGTMADEVSTTLQNMLIERGVQGEVNYLRAGPDDGPVQAIVYSVTGPIIRVRKVEFNGAAPPELATLQALGQELLGHEYVRSSLLARVDSDFLSVYQAHGYLKAAFSDIHAKVLPGSPQENGPQQVGVDITLRVTPGKVYSLAGIQWSGNKVIPTAQLEAQIHAPAGRPMNAVQFAEDLHAVRQLYGARGYVAATVKPAPQFDEVQATVSYRLQVQEGDIYHMGDLELEGLDEHDAGRVFAKWALHKGDTYDGSYPQRFVNDTLKTDPLSQSRNVIIHEFPDARDKTVDMTLRFDKKSPEL